MNMSNNGLENFSYEVKLLKDSSKSNLKTIDYLRSFASTENYVIYNISNMCQSCLDKFSIGIENKLNDELVRELSLIIIADSKYQVKKYLKKYNLKKYSSIIYIDNKNKYKMYFEPTGYFRFIQVKDNSIIHEEIISTNKVNKLLDEIY